MIKPFYNSSGFANNLSSMRHCSIIPLIKTLFFFILFAIGLLYNSNESFAKEMSWYKGQFGESFFDDFMKARFPGYCRIGPINTSAHGPDLIYELPARIRKDFDFEIHEVKCYNEWALGAKGKSISALKTTVGGLPAYELSDLVIENFINNELNNPNSKYSSEGLKRLQTSLKQGRVRLVCDEINTAEKKLRQSLVKSIGKSDIKIDMALSESPLKKFERIISPETRKLKQLVFNYKLPEASHPDMIWRTANGNIEKNYVNIAKQEQVDAFSKFHNKSINTRTKGVRYQSPKLAEYKATHGKELFSKTAKTIASKPIKQSVIKATPVNPNYVRTIENATKSASLAGKTGKAVVPISKGLETVGIRASYISRAAKGAQLTDKGGELSNVVRAARLAEGTGDAVAQFGKVIEVGGMVVGVVGSAIDISLSAYKIYETNVAYRNYELDSDIYAWKMIVEGIQLRAGVFILLCTISPDPFSKIAVWIFVGESIVAAIIDDWLTQIQEQRHRNICRMMKFANYRMRHDCIAEVLRRMAVEI